MKNTKNWVLALGLTFGSLCANAGDVRTDHGQSYYATGRGVGELKMEIKSTTTTINASIVLRVQGGTANNNINYHGGPLLNSANGTNMYYIWYGDWTGNTAPSILTDLANGLSGSPWYNINTTYADRTGKKITNSVHLLQQTSDNYSQGKVLSDAQIQNVVESAITTGYLPKDSNAVYFVLTSADVNASSGFCTKYCAWHTKANIGGTTIKYSFVGNTDRCPNACSPQNIGPNGNAGADSMASLIAHELTETVTDPELNAWYDSRGLENGDKCAWSFGAVTKLPSGAKYNMVLGNRKFLIQQNWVNANGGYCASRY